MKSVVIATILSVAAAAPALQALGSIRRQIEEVVEAPQADLGEAELAFLAIVEECQTKVAAGETDTLDDCVLDALNIDRQSLGRRQEAPVGSINGVPDTEGLIAGCIADSGPGELHECLVAIYEAQVSGSASATGEASASETGEASASETGDAAASETSDEAAPSETGDEAPTGTEEEEAEETGADAASDTGAEAPSETGEETDEDAPEETGDEAPTGTEEEEEEPTETGAPQRFVRF